MNGTELERLADRLRRVDRALRWAGSTWLICIVVVLVLGAGAQRAASQYIQETISARRFLVVDASNATRLELGISKEGNPGIWLWDAADKVRVHFGIDGGVRPEILFSSSNETERLRVGTKSNGQGGVWMFTQDGKLTWSAPRGMFGGIRP